MGTSIIIARIFSVVLLFSGIGALINPNYYKKIATDFTKSSAEAYMGGLMATILGLGVLSVHNTWSSDWTTIITVLGWGATIKGVLILALPKPFMDFSVRVSQTKLMWIYSIFGISFGLILGYFGYIA